MPLTPRARLSTTLLSTVLLAALAACGGGGNDSTPGPTTPGTTPPVTTPPVTTPPVSPPPAVAPDTFTPGAATTGGSADASTAIAQSAAFMIVADDESNLLRVYPRAGGEAVLEWSYALNGPKFAKELDLEASVKIGDTLYFAGSHSNKKDGGDAMADRGHVFAVKTTGVGAATAFQYVGQFADLERQLAAWDAANTHGLGANAFGLTASAAAGIAPERVDGFSIEGMTSNRGDTAVWLGFRAPLANTALRDKALIVPVNNLPALIAGTTTQAVFGTPLQLNLGGRGIRSIDKGTDGNYLILAGPAAGASAAVTRNFALYTWNGDPTIAPVELDNDLETLRKATGGSFETIVEVPGPVVAGTAVQLLLDNGDTVFTGTTSVAKDLPAAEQRFQGFRTVIGNPLRDAQGPALVTSTPADDRVGVNVDTQIVLQFDEGVRLGAGNITLRTANGAAVETFNANSAATRVQVRFNTLTLTPTAPLQNNAGYFLTLDPTAVLDHQGNGYAGLSGPTALNFTAAGTPTPLAVNDLLFVGANAEAPDAFAFALLKAVNGGTRITFTDRNRKTGTGEFTGVTNEGVFVWTADRNLPAGSIVTIQTDTPASPIADKGFTIGSPAGLGKEETIYAYTGGAVAGLGDGTAGEITAVGPFLASITLGGAAGTIPAELTAAGTAIDFSVSPTNQTNALYAGPLDRADLAAFAARVKNKSNWKLSYKPALGYPLTATGSLFAGE